MNSQCTFDDYLKMAQSHFLYECTFNPEVVFENELHHTHNTDEGVMTPEFIVESEHFYRTAQEEYATYCHGKL